MEGALSFQTLLIVLLVGLTAASLSFLYAPEYLTYTLGALGAALVLPPAAASLWRRRQSGRVVARRPVYSTAHSLSRLRSTVDSFQLAPAPDVPGLVDYLLHQAVLNSASDIHIVPYRDFAQVRFRVDGQLADVAQLTGVLREPVTNRLKVLSGAVVFVHDRPQDGRLDVVVGEREVDVRAAFMPTLHGERIVLRILDRAEVELGLSSLVCAATGRPARVASSTAAESSSSE